MDGLLASLDAATDYLTPVDRDRVSEAFRFAEEAHRGMTRRSGEAYITHPVAVTALLAEMHLDVNALMAGLLHDTVEDTPATL